MGNDERWPPRCWRRRPTGEPVWRAAAAGRYRKESTRRRRLKNVGGGYGGALIAGVFLQEFVDDVPWAHLDIAGPARAESDDGYLTQGLHRGHRPHPADLAATPQHGPLTGRPADLVAAGLVRWSGWAVTRASAGRRAYRVPASGPAAAVHLTTVVRLPAPVAEALAPALDRLRALGPGHHWYPPETMHVTVQNLDGAVPADRIEQGARDLVAAHRPFRLTVRGLGVAPGAVYVLALPGDATLRSLRAGLGRLAAGRRPGRLRVGRGLGHASKHLN